MSKKNKKMQKKERLSPNSIINLITALINLIIALIGANAIMKS